MQVASNINKLTKVEREQLKAVAAELGHDDFDVQQRGHSHKMAVWRGGRVTIASSPSTTRCLAQLRARVRRQIREVETTS